MLSKTEEAEKKGRVSANRTHNIFVFHKLTNHLTFGSTNYSPGRFSRLVETIIEAGYRFVSLDESVESTDPMNVAITFDDGYAHLMQELPPLIEKFDLKPAVFIPTAFIGLKNSWDYSSVFKSERHLDESEIRDLAALGVRFGSHGHRHIDLVGCSVITLQDELTKSKEILENITERTIHDISYPFGRYNQTVLAEVTESGYKHAFTMNFPHQSDDQLKLGRIPIYFFETASLAKEKLNSGRVRTIHKNVGRFINSLSYGTILFNKLTGRDGD